MNEHYRSVLSPGFLDNVTRSQFGDYRPDDEPEELITLRRGDAIDLIDGSQKQKADQPLDCRERTWV